MSRSEGSRPLLAGLWLGLGLFLAPLWYLAGFGAHFALAAAVLALLGGAATLLVRLCWVWIASPGRPRAWAARLLGLVLALAVPCAAIAAIFAAMHLAGVLGLGRPDAVGAGLVGDAAGLGFRAATDPRPGEGAAERLAGAPIRIGAGILAGLYAGIAAVMLPLLATAILGLVAILMGTGEAVRALRRR